MQEIHNKIFRRHSVLAELPSSRRGDFCRLFGDQRDLYFINKTTIGNIGLANVVLSKKEETT